MSKKLVAYFSASGVTKAVAESLAAKVNADLFEIVPEALYTPADLDWKDKQSRSTLEMQDKSCRPAVSGKVGDMSIYDTVFVGFPVWWGREPSVVDTFLDENDMTGKTIIPFCTSGGSSIDGAVENIKAVTDGKAVVGEGKRLAGEISEEDLKIWEA